MRAEAFRRLTAELEKLTPRQKQLLADRLHAQSQATEVHGVIESRLGSAPVCPHCAHPRVVRWGKVSGLQRYRCGACHN
ncbi:MAG: IS1 family transposase [Pseudomonadales bacterium]|nr:IS1 family transposase [Pseudomonadales bacterium]